MDHKSWVGGVFDRTAPGYGKNSSSFFNYFGRRLVDLSGVSSKKDVLDVATGRGAVLFPLREAVGSSGKIIGVDISREMIRETAKEVHERNLKGIDLQWMDAENLEFPNESFDFIFCGFALFFFPSILKALSEFKRVLRKGGKLALSIWGEDSELDAWMHQKLISSKSLAASPIWSGVELEKILKETGFDDPKIIEETKVFYHETAEAWWESLWTHGTRAKFEQLSSGQLDALRKDAIKMTKDLDRGEGIPESLQVFYAIATKKI